MIQHIRARFDGKVFIPLDPVDWQAGDIFDIEVTPIGDPPLGSRDAVLKAMREPPHISAEDAAEFERLIKEGQMPVNYRGCFDEEEDT